MARTTGQSSRKEYKKKKRQEARSKWHRQPRESAYFQSISTNGTSPPNIKTYWCYRAYRHLDLYPKITREFKDPDNKGPPRKPTPEELSDALQLVKSNFTLFDHGRVVVLDHNRRDHILAIIEFTPIKDLSPTEHDDLQFLSRFLHRSKQFVKPVKSGLRSWGGKMWALGWRKAMVTAQLIGRYIYQLAVSKHKDKYNKLMSKSNRASQILGGMFQKMADVPFSQNQDLMKQNNIPSFSHLSFNNPLSNHDCSPHLTFTTHGFYNVPHHDKRDLSSFAFALFIPHDKRDGTMANPDQGYNVSGGPFVVPDYRFGIDFSSQKGIVKLLWRSKELKHCTLPPLENSHFTRLGLSLQINKKISNTCAKIKDGSIFRTKKNKMKKMYIADHQYYLDRE